MIRLLSQVKNVCNLVLSYDFWRLDDLSCFQQSSSFRNSKKILSNIYVAEISQSLNLIYSLLESGESSAWGYTTIPIIEVTQDFNFRLDIQSMYNLTTDKNGWNPIWTLTFYQNYSRSLLTIGLLENKVLQIHLIKLAWILLKRNHLQKDTVDFLLGKMTLEIHKLQYFCLVLDQTEIQILKGL